MKLLSFRAADGLHLGVKTEKGVVDAGRLDLADAFSQLTSLAATVQAADRFLDEAALAVVAPIPRPGKIVCVGLNYFDHAKESNMAVPERPLLFSKWANSVVGPGEAIQLPVDSTQVDYEAEFGIVIGRKAKGVSVEEALEYVGGYTCLNDVSARDFQFGDGQWVRGKAQDTFCPMGPYVVTRDEVPDPQNLRIRCILNGQTVQDSSTAQMVFGVRELVAFISRGITLEPGDLIATGTPPGVGFARKPPLFLKHGDSVTIEIEGLGSLTNPVQGV